jgi:hypothetical protein
MLLLPFELHSLLFVPQRNDWINPSSADGGDKAARDACD